MLFEKPITMVRESKPGEKPQNGVRAACRYSESNLYRNSLKQVMDDTPTFLLLRWTGLRVSDAVRLQWKNVHFGRGNNGEIEIATQKTEQGCDHPIGDRTTREPCVFTDTAKASQRWCCVADDSSSLTPRRIETFLTISECVVIAHQPSRGT